MSPFLPVLRLYIRNEKTGGGSMVFSSIPFLYVFMPIFFGVYYLVPDRRKNAVLLLGSLCFYAVGTLETPGHFFVFLLSMVVDYLVGALIELYTARKKLFLILGICFHLVCLGFFKYFAFFVNDVLGVIPGVELSMDLKILLPIGISFYTFQGISYIADVYRGKIRAERSLLRFCVYISMFEQLIAGPIVTYSQVRRDLRKRRIRKQDVLDGLGLFIFGMGLKVLLANPIGKLWLDVNMIGFESISTPLAWMGIIAFSFQLYFDFFGYSLMAIGLGKMLGFHLPTNFDFPYLSRSMTEFWRRWHITLGSWFRDYVYIPLGGNRAGKLKTIRNLLIVWLLTGFWHGAGYNFILWGFVLFLLIFGEKYLYGQVLERHKVLGHGYMILLIPLTWAIFAIDDMGQLGMFYSRLFPVFGESPWSVFQYDYLKYLKLYYPFFLAGILLSTRLPFRLLQRIKSQKILWAIRLVILAACTYCMYKGMNDPFLYFRF